MNQVAITEMLVRFYGTGTERDFGGVLGIFVRKPYEAAREHLSRVVGSDLEDITDPNDETSFGFVVDGYVLRLSMVGPFALLLGRGGEPDVWIPVLYPTTDLEQTLIDGARAHGFLLMGGDELETMASAWAGEPATSLYGLLFVSGQVPWNGRSG